jgi:hypothetical protein
MFLKRNQSTLSSCIQSFEITSKELSH